MEFLRVDYWAPIIFLVLNAVLLLGKSVHGRIIPQKMLHEEMVKLYHGPGPQKWSSVENSNYASDPFEFIRKRSYNKRMKRSLPPHANQPRRIFSRVLNPSRGGISTPLSIEIDSSASRNNTHTDKRRQLLIYNPLGGGMSYLPTESFYNAQSFPMSPYGTIGAGGLGTFPPFSGSNFGGGMFMNPYAMAGTGFWPFPQIPTGIMSPGINPLMLGGGQINPFAAPNNAIGPLATGIMSPGINPFMLGGGQINPFAAPNNAIGPLVAANLALRFNQAQFYNNIPLARSGTSYSPNIMTSLAASQIAGTNLAAAGNNGGGLGRFGEYGSIGLRPIANALFPSYGNRAGFNNFFPG